MKSIRCPASLACLAALIFSAPAALADGVCHAGIRDTTAAERTKMTSVLQAAKSAMPPAPQGWVIAGDDAITVPHSICGDVEKVPWSYGFSRAYRQVGDYESRQKLIVDQAARNAAAMQQKQPRLDALQAQMQKLVEAQIALVQKGDNAGAQKYNTQIAKLQDQYGQIANEGSDPAADAAVNKQFNRDLEMSIVVNVNPGSENAEPGAKPFTAPASAKSALRWHVEDANQSTDHALYLFGAWMPGAAGKWRSAARTGVPFPGAHTISVHVRADSGRITQTIAAIDFAKIASPLK